MRYLIPAALMLTTTACPGGRPAPVPAEEQAQTVVEIVVANQQSASASLIPGDGGVARHLAVGNGPHEAAISPDGRTAVVTIYGAQIPGSQLAVIDLERDTVIRTIELAPYTRPHGVVFLADRNDRVVVTSESTQNIVLVDLNTGAMEAIATGARGSHMVAVNAAGTRGWTANVADNSVSELDLVRRRLIRSFAVPLRPEGIAVTPDGAEVWVGSNETGAVSVVSTASGSIIATLTETRFPYRLTAFPNGRRIAIVDGMGNRLVIADVATHAIVGGIDLVSPRGVAIAPDSRTGYVTLAEGALAIVDLEAMAVLRTVAVQASPDGVAVGWRRAE